MAFSGFRIQFAATCVGALLEQCSEVAKQLRSPAGRHAWSADATALSHGVRRVTWLWRAYAQRDLSIWNCLENWATQRPKSRALSDETESIDWATLRERAKTWAAVLVALGVKDGARVALIAENSVNLVVAMLAIQAAGGVAIALDPRCSWQWLSESLAELRPALVLLENPQNGQQIVPPANCCVATFSDLQHVGPTTPLEMPIARGRYGSRPFVILATSGTTGTPKSVVISNARCVLSGFGIAGFCLALTEKDAVYCPLPLSHATALMTGFSAAMVSGCAFVMRRRFVPDEFWRNVATANATCLLYVGELVRTLLSVPSKPEENTHQLRVAYGNGMGLDIWHKFQSRFGIARILEFYGATELPLALVNLAGRPGYVGRTALGRLSPWRVVLRDTQSGELLRKGDGTCTHCKPLQSGELLLLTRPLSRRKCDSPAATGTGREHMQLVCSVAKKGDAGIRTGDIVVRDANGYVKFEDRTFEIFRQQGRNVSAAELVRVMRTFDGIAAIGVTHLSLPHYDGQLGLAVIVPSSGFNLNSLEQSYRVLSTYARPRFLRISKALRLNRNFKFDHASYRAEGVDPSLAQEPVFAYARGIFEPISAEIWAKLSLGQFRF